MAKGLAGTVFLATDDCQADYETLSARASSSSKPPRTGPTGSTPASGTLRATTCG